MSRELGASPDDLSLSTVKLSHKDLKSKQPTASWEDDVSAGEEPHNPVTKQTAADCPAPPPPTPISPTSPHFNREPSSKLSPRNDPAVRADKTDAVAKRLVAGALGLKTPARTESQKAYDRAMKEKEMKRRNREKETKMRADEEVARAKAAIWND